MSASIAQAGELNDCGCCSGISAETPRGIENRPGLSAIAYRVGTHSQFRETLHARLSTSGNRALAGFSTRDNDDFSIALLDAWALVGDVLTFYQERIANESYLRTATERLSVLELARLINYELRPGVAAGTYLAFTIEDTPGAAGQVLALGTSAQIAPASLPPVTIGSGTKVQSIPGPGEQAQTFETVEEIQARPEWNAIKPRLTQPQHIAGFLDHSLIFQGTTTEIKKGARLLILSGGNLPLPKTALRVTVDEEAKTTRVDFEESAAALPSFATPNLPQGQAGDFAPQTELSAAATQKIISRSWDQADLTALIAVQNWDSNSLSANLRKEIARQTLNDNPKVLVYRQQATVFGFNAPKIPKYNGNIPEPNNLWPDWPRDSSENELQVFLDRAYEDITPKSFVTIEKPGSPFKAKTFQVKETKTLARTAYSISAKTTQLTLAESWWTPLLPVVKGSTTGSFATERLKAKVALVKTTDSAAVVGTPVAVIGRGTIEERPALIDFRDVVVYAQSEPLPLAELPIEEVLDPAKVQAAGLTLDGPYLGLANNQRIILKGERNDLKGVFSSESLTIRTAKLVAGFTVLTFNESLTYPYVRKTVNINANVANATHGETVQETLGGGDATQAFQRFTLRQPPLTYVTSADPSGAQSTLEIRVNDILWSEVPDFFGHGPDERIYTTKLDDLGNTTVIFGDGTTGARLPTGQENVKAKYRKGIGLAGLVKADQLAQLMTRPLGVKGVTNPLAASGAANAELLAEARRNAPLTVLTLGRIVSLKDYEDFARSFSGIDKALATWTWFGEKRGIFVTVAGPNGAAIREDSQLFKFLVQAMQSAGNPLVPLQVKSYQARLFRIVAALKIDPAFLKAKVLAQAEEKLRAAFSFAARSFGQPVHLSEVIAVLQGTAGVLAVNVTALYRSNEPVDRHEHLAAAVPAPARTQVAPAEILTLDLQPLNLGTFE